MSAFRPNFRDPKADLPEAFNDLSPDDRERILNERTRLLHIFAQWSWHNEARIVGNRNALIVLRDAIEAALSDGKSSTIATVSDGESYSVEIELNDAPWSSPAWESQPRPYIDPVATGERDLTWDVSRLRQALREANAGLFKRGGKPIADPIDRGAKA